MNMPSFMTYILMFFSLDVFIFSCLSPYGNKIKPIKFAFLAVVILTLSLHFSQFGELGNKDLWELFKASFALVIIHFLGEVIVTDTVAQLSERTEATRKVFESISIPMFNFIRFALIYFLAFLYQVMFILKL